MATMVVRGPLFWMGERHCDVMYVCVFFHSTRSESLWRLLAQHVPKSLCGGTCGKTMGWKHRKWLNSFHFTNPIESVATSWSIAAIVESTSPIVSAHDDTFVLRAVWVIHLCKCRAVCNPSGSGSLWSHVMVSANCRWASTNALHSMGGFRLRSLPLFAISLTSSIYMCNGTWWLRYTFINSERITDENDALLKNSAPGQVCALTHLAVPRLVQKVVTELRYFACDFQILQPEMRAVAVAVRSSKWKLFCETAKQKPLDPLEPLLKENASRDGFDSVLKLWNPEPSLNFADLWITYGLLMDLMAGVLAGPVAASISFSMRWVRCPLFVNL